MISAVPSEDSAVPSEDLAVPSEDLAIPSENFPSIICHFWVQASVSLHLERFADVLCSFEPEYI